MKLLVLVPYPVTLYCFVSRGQVVGEFVLQRIDYYEIASSQPGIEGPVHHNVLHSVV